MVSVSRVRAQIGVGAAMGAALAAVWCACLSPTIIAAVGAWVQRVGPRWWLGQRVGLLGVGVLVLSTFERYFKRRFRHMRARDKDTDT